MRRVLMLLLLLPGRRFGTRGFLRKDFGWPVRLLALAAGGRGGRLRRRRHFGGSGLVG